MPKNVGVSGKKSTGSSSGVRRDRGASSAASGGALSTVPEPGPPITSGGGWTAASCSSRPQQCAPSSTPTGDTNSKGTGSPWPITGSGSQRCRLSPHLRLPRWRRRRPQARRRRRRPALPRRRLPRPAEHRGEGRPAADQRGRSGSGATLLHSGVTASVGRDTVHVDRRQ